MSILWISVVCSLTFNCQELSVQFLSLMILFFFLISCIINKSLSIDRGGFCWSHWLWSRSWFLRLMSPSALTCVIHHNFIIINVPVDCFGVRRNLVRINVSVYCFGVQIPWLHICHCPHPWKWAVVEISSSSIQNDICCYLVWWFSNAFGSMDGIVVSSCTMAVVCLLFCPISFFGQFLWIISSRPSHSLWPIKHPHSMIAVVWVVVVSGRMGWCTPQRVEGRRPRHRINHEPERLEFFRAKSGNVWFPLFVLSIPTSGCLHVSHALIGILQGYLLRH